MGRRNEKVIHYKGNEGGQDSQKISQLHYLSFGNINQTTRNQFSFVGLAKRTTIHNIQY